MTMDFSPESKRFFVRAALIALALAVIVIVGLWVARIIGLESIWIAALAIFYLEFCVAFAYYHACKFAARPARAAVFGFLCIVFWNYFVIASAIAVPVMIAFAGLVLSIMPAPLSWIIDPWAYLEYLVTRSPECVALVFLALFLPFLFYYLAVLGLLIWRAITLLVERFRQPPQKRR